MLTNLYFTEQNGACLLLTRSLGMSLDNQLASGTSEDEIRKTIDDATRKTWGRITRDLAETRDLLSYKVFIFKVLQHLNYVSSAKSADQPHRVGKALAGHAKRLLSAIGKQDESDLDTFEQYVLQYNAQFHHRIRPDLNIQDVETILHWLASYEQTLHERGIVNAKGLNSDQKEKMDILSWAMNEWERCTGDAPSVSHEETSFRKIFDLIIDENAPRLKANWRYVEDKLKEGFRIY